MDVDDAPHDDDCVNAEDEDIMDDDDLRAALALSMQPLEKEEDQRQRQHRLEDCSRATAAATAAAFATSSATTACVTATATTTPPLFADDNNYECRHREEDFDCRSFHSLMWDDAGTSTTTTDDDKERWIYECISTPFLRRQRLEQQQRQRQQQQQQQQ